MASTPKLLLIQVRDEDDPMRQHEVDCFARRAGLPDGSVVAFDAVHTSPSLRELSGYDALLFGGSGEYNVSQQNQPGLPALFELIQEIVTVGHPTFASCYGFQCMVAALGGEVILDAEASEVGTYRMELTAEGVDDPLLGTLPPVFYAQQGHKDRALRLPEGFSNLAHSELTPLQAMRVPNQPVWAVQFHPELDQTANRQRFEHYLEAYSKYMTADEREKALDRFRPSPEASDLLGHFVAML